MLSGWRSVVGVMLVLAAGCGESETAAPSSPSPTSTSPTAGPDATGPGATAGPAGTGTSQVRTVVPDVVLRDVGTGADVNLRAAAARPDRPTLYWFWAPH